jgi:drug/metabolite transporter (DMT)-like permease
MNDRVSPFRLTLAFAAVYLIWGSTYLGIRIAIESIPPFLMAGARFVIAGGILYFIARLRGGEPPGLPQWRSALVIGAFLLVGGNGVVTWAEQRIPSGIAALLIATVPLWMVLLEWLVLGGVRPGPRVVSGLIAGTIGIVLLTDPFNISAAIDPVGFVAIMISTLSWSVGSLFSRRLALPQSPLLGTAMEMLGGGLLLLLVGVCTGEPGRFDIHMVTIRSMVAFAYLTLFGSLIGFTAYIWLLHSTIVSRVTTHAYVNPAIALVLGWWLGNEPQSLRTFLAAGVIITAVVLILTGKTASREVRSLSVQIRSPGSTDPLE